MDGILDGMGGPSSYMDEGNIVVVDTFPDFTLVWGIVILTIIVFHLLWSFFQKSAYRR